MSAIVFLVWSLGFWPIAILSGYGYYIVLRARTNIEWSEGLGLLIFLLFLTWLIGTISSFRIYRLKQGVRFEEESADEGANRPVLLIIESPSEELDIKDPTSGKVLGNSLEFETSVQALPENGNIFVLNPDNSDESTVVGTVCEVIPNLLASDGEYTHFIWVLLKNPDDFLKLDHSAHGWSRGIRKRSRPLA